MKAKIFFFSLLIAGCNPGDPVVADYRGQLLEYGTEDVIEGAQVKLLNPVASGPSGAGSYETVWQGFTDQNGVFTTPRCEGMQLAYFIGDSSFFDLGTQQASWIELDEPLQKFYLMGKSPLKLTFQDTGQVQLVSCVELFPFSPNQSSTLQIPLNSFPFYSVVYANYPQHLSFRLHFLNGSKSDCITQSLLTASRGDTTQAVLYY